MDYERAEGDTEDSKEVRLCGVWRVLSEKGCVGGVIWRFDDVEGQYVLYFHVGGNKVSVASSLFFVFIVMSSYSNIPWIRYV
jgi:hypothetical protein